MIVWLGVPMGLCAGVVVISAELYHLGHSWKWLMTGRGE